jgi:hypothetical protein
MVDWTHIRPHKISNERHDDWQADVRAHLTGGIEPVWDQGRYGSAILGRQAGQDAQQGLPSSARRWR